MPKSDDGSISDSAEDSDRLMSSLERESIGLWKDHRLVAIATLGLPIWAAGAALAGAFIFGGLALAKKLVLVSVASAAAGRFIIWAGDGVDQSGLFSAFELAILVFSLDAIWAVVLTWHAGLLFRLPWLGLRLKLAVQEGSLLLKKNRWMRRLTVGAVLTFVMLPISSTGSIGGSILGRLLGLSRTATLLTVLIGSLMGGIVMVAFAKALAPWFQGMNPAVQYSGILLIVLTGFVISQRYRRSLSG